MVELSVRESHRLGAFQIAPCVVLQARECAMKMQRRRAAQLVDQMTIDKQLETRTDRDRCLRGDDRWKEHEREGEEVRAAHGVFPWESLYHA